ncbi:methyltransferase domain-containing protein, partial [Candidatus Woesearchaeota archaeon]|nr:methyltransferase domain-containing protein [Candidatus Woesearchaeota archaeon]
MELDVQSKHQHFLIDEKAIARILNYAFLNKNDVVLEIGAGTGNLTEKLLQKAKHVLAIEKDENLVKVLKNKFRNKKNVTIIHGDVLKIKLPSFNKCISNIPYNICEPLIWKLVRTNFEMCLFTISKKFYEKLTAKPNTKNYCLISMIAQHFYEI